MEPATDRTISQEAPPTLQCKRSLLPIDEYTAREGLSKDIVEECGKLGIIQIRKYKGKTFVVDVPLSPYLRPAPTLGNDNQTGCEHPHARKAGAEPGIVNKPTRLGKSRKKTARTEDPLEVIQTPELETSNNPTETLEIINESTETKEAPRPAPTLQNDKSHLDSPAAQAEPRRVLPAATILLSIILLAAVFSNLWLYMDRQIQLDRLNQAHAGIQQAHNDLAQTNQRAETLQNELNDYRAELRRTQNELSNSKAEVKGIQDELTRTTQTLRAAQQRNSEAVERLNEQIRRLTTQLTELTEPPPAPPGSIQN